jgi:hypothetical protein
MCIHGTGGLRYFRFYLLRVLAVRSIHFKTRSSPVIDGQTVTDAEYDALDEYYTQNPPKVSGDGKSGFFEPVNGVSRHITPDVHGAWQPILRLFPF